MNHTDGGDPKCFTLDSASRGCADAIKILQLYWISFIRTLDPNTLRSPGMPAWEAWTIVSPRRIVFDNTNATVETRGAGIGEITAAGMNQRQRFVQLVLPIAKAKNAGLMPGADVTAFANGTATDPTLAGSNGTGMNQTMTEKSGNKTGNATTTSPKSTFTGAAGNIGLA